MHNKKLFGPNCVGDKILLTALSFDLHCRTDAVGWTILSKKIEVSNFHTFHCEQSENSKSDLLDHFFWQVTSKKGVILSVD